MDNSPAPGRADLTSKVRDLRHVPLGAPADRGTKPAAKRGEGEFSSSI